MAAPDRCSSTGIDWRSSAHFVQTQEREDDSGYDLEAMGISDGFRPTETHRISHDQQLSNTRPQEQIVRRNTPPPRPSSTSKAKHDSLTLRHDGTMGPAAMNPADPNTLGRRLSRSSMTSNEMAFDGAGGPYRGITSPSHAYQLHSQEPGLHGTPSTGIAAPILVQGGSFAGPSRPIHPYGLYPQNIVPETDSSPQSTPIPIGFPGMNTYQPRPCPDRETAEIVGPDGHTEQLPPYTQYPIDGSGRAARPVAVMPLPPLPSVLGAGGIGLATRNPEFESRETLGSPPSRQSTISDLSSHQSNTTTLPRSEKPELKKWQRVGRKRLCSVVPIWAIALAAIVFVLLIVVLTAIMAARHNAEIMDYTARSVCVCLVSSFKYANVLSASKV